MKTKFFSLLLTILASSGILSAEIVEIDYLYYNIDTESKTAEVTSQLSDSPYWHFTLSSANIPSSIRYNSETYRVTSIGDFAFYNCSGMGSVTIPNSITNIGNDAFYGCSQLKRVYISDLSAWCKINFSNEASNPLSNCHDLYLNGELLEDLIIPDDITCIRDGAFAYCYSLLSVFIPNSVTSIGNRAFMWCRSLASATIGDNVASIGEEAFVYSGLISVALPNSVKNIGEAAFASSSKLTSITISNGVTSIEKSVFADCPSLSSVIIPNSVTDIRNFAFSDCSSLTKIEIPNSVTYIGGQSFARTGLINVTIPNSVTRIGRDAFYGCSDLATVTIGNNVESIGSYAFFGCFNLTSITNYATTPQSIDSNMFFYLNKSACTLYVPEESIDVYKNADGWKDFPNIQAINDISTDVESNKVKHNIHIFFRNGQLLILHDGKTYTTQGIELR